MLLLTLSRSRPFLFGAVIGMLSVLVVDVDVVDVLIVIVVQGCFVLLCLCCFVEIGDVLGHQMYFSFCSFFLLLLSFFLVLFTYR